MVMIPGGSFVMGSPPDEPEAHNTERPQHTVDMPAFAVGVHEVTFEQWDACVADGGCYFSPDDEGWGRGDRPVINVSWHEAQLYLAWLSDETGHSYRLLSESESEYVTRAGTTGRFNTGNCITTDQANFLGYFPYPGCPSGVYREQTLSVGSFLPNAFGLYDTHGNVSEWTQDCYNFGYEGAPTDGSAWMTGDCEKAILRSGSWGMPGEKMRSSFRSGVSRDLRRYYIGFRVARAVTP
ncbi:formylglycine-generating enzyme family protein [Wenzhouxiangella sp. 15190]|nr:formylglycine-generating enzyme family protein [Wenzhouxiangella sp. 15190]